MTFDREMQDALMLDAHKLRDEGVDVADPVFIADEPSDGPSIENHCEICEELESECTCEVSKADDENGPACGNADCGHPFLEHDNEGEIIGGQCFECPCAMFVFPDDGEAEP